MQMIFDDQDVTIRDVPPTPVAMLEHRGDRATIPETRERFIAWRKAAGLSPETSPTFMVFRSERQPANPADYSMDLCLGTDQPVAANDQQVKAGVIPGGRCAIPATPTTSSPPRYISIVTGCRPAARKRATFRSIASGGWKSSRRWVRTKWSWSCSCR